MHDSDRFRLLYGPYRTPRFRYGSIVFCDVRGEVRIVRLSDARIPWPIGARGRARSLIVYRDLARALRKESGIAICHWWGVTSQTVSKWRKALDIGPVTEGTSELKRQHFDEEWGWEARRKSWAKARDPERCRKIAEARKGKPRPRHVIEAWVAGRHRCPESEETRRRMSETRKRLGLRPPDGARLWTPEEDELVRRCSATEVVRRTGRTPIAVQTRRRRLGVLAGRKKDECREHSR